MQISFAWIRGNSMEFEYKGYKVIQSSFNWHVSIFDENKHCVMHINRDKPINRSIAEMFVNQYINMSQGG